MNNDHLRQLIRKIENRSRGFQNKRLGLRNICLGLLCVVLLPFLALAQKPHVLMISIDGMKPEYVTQASQHHLKLPVLERFLTQGVYAEGVTGVIPTVTYPSHTTLVTGVSPAEHGILANTTFDPLGEHPGEWYWYFRELKARTLYQAVDQAGMKTAAVGWPVTVGAPIDYLIAEMGQSEKTDVPKGDLVSPVDLKDRIGVKIPAGADGDEKKTQWSIGIINTYNPNFVLVHLTELDHQEHQHGPFSLEANETIEKQDGLVGQLIAAELAKNKDARVVIVSDHGFVPVSHKVALNVLFAKAGLLRVRPGHVNDGTSRIESWDAQAWESGGSAAVMVRNQTDPAVMVRVQKLLALLSSDPQYGVNKIVGHDDIVRHGGNPDAAFLIDFKPGWASVGSLRGEAVRDTPGIGTHGYLPEHPELRSAFMMMGEGIAHGRNLGVIDMRQIAPTVAEMMGVGLPAVRMAPVHYEP
jgi:predicted AlkP superfamily pyrophosphatase or phosphodiesterase